jgi:hypothetical protein
MRRAPREEGARWLQQAVEDLRWAEDLAERGGGGAPGERDRDLRHRSAGSDGG